MYLLYPSVHPSDHPKWSLQTVNFTLNFTLLITELNKDDNSHSPGSCFNPCPAEPGCTLFCKQRRSRSVGFWRSQLIWICTVCHSECEFISTICIKEFDWLKICKGRGILIYSAGQGLTFWYASAWDLNFNEVPSIFIWIQHGGFSNTIFALQYYIIRGLSARL